MHLIALLIDVVREVVNWVGGRDSIDIDHSFGQHRNDSLHQELAHVQQLRVLKLLHMRPDLDQPLLLQLLQRFTFPLFFLQLSGVGFFGVINSFSFFLHQVLFAFLVELGYCWQIIVGATIAFDVDAHVFEHLKSVTVCFELKHFSLMLLKETRHWELAWLCLWVAEVSSVVCSFKQRYVVFVIEVFKTAGHVFSVPLEVALCV